MTNSHSTRASRAIAGRNVAVDGADQPLGSFLARTLAECGASVHLRGQDAGLLQKLRYRIAEAWGNAVIDDNGGTDVTVRLTEDPDRALDQLSDTKVAPVEILIFTGPSRGTGSLQTRLEEFGQQHVHMLVLPGPDADFDRAVLGELVCLFASPLGLAVKNTLVALNAGVADVRPNFPEMTICAPTVVP